MTSELELPEDVKTAIHANRKIEAIKLLREHRGIGLKESKQAVEEYIAQLPAGVPTRSGQSDTGLGRLLFLGFCVALVYLLYKYFS
jgi:hypothetical protein